MYFIGIDIGTTNTKICLYRDKDFSCVQKYTFTTPKKINGEFADFDVDILWENIIEKLRSIVSQNIDIDNICIASIGESGVLIDENGNVNGPAITWYDTRTIPQAKYVIDLIGLEKIYKITGLPAHSNYSVNKILWILENCNIKNKKKLKWLSIASYIAYKLSGSIAIDYSLASRTMLFDINNMTWSKEILEKLKLDIDLMPDLVESGETIGELRQELTNQFGTSKKISISIGGHDHMCGAIATGLFDKSELLDSTGTTEGLLMIRDKPCLQKDYLDKFLSNGVYTLVNNYTLFASLPAAGLSFEWMRKTLFNNKLKFDEIFKDIDSVNCNDLIYVPHIRGSGPPNRHAMTKGIIYGIEDTTSNFEIAKSVLEGVCFESKILYESMLEKVENKPKIIKVIGSAVRNHKWLQLKADILNCNVEAYDIDEAVAKGAALLGAYKRKKINLSDIKEINRNKTIEFTPRLQNTKYYDEKFNTLYKPIYNVSLKMRK